MLIRRRNEPFKGSYALPGGFVEAGETIEDACRREVKEETNLEIYDMRQCIPAQAGIPEDTLSLSRLGRELTLRS